MVHCLCVRLNFTKVRMNISRCFNLRKGPPEVGRFENWTWKRTPIPSGLAVAETEPLMLCLGSVGLKKDWTGRVAA